MRMFSYKMISFWKFHNSNEKLIAQFDLNKNMPLIFIQYQFNINKNLGLGVRDI
jgi:hypothetical protein